MAHQVYENFILSNKINDILTTALNINNYLTVDTSMTEGPGMKKKVNTYTSTGDVEALAMGAGNSKGIEVQFTTAEYDVLTYQGMFDFYDEQELSDPMVVDTGLQHVADRMINKFVALTIDEFEKATLKQEADEWSFDVVVDAIAQMNLEDEAGLFLLISPADKANFRKALKDDLSYSEGFVRTGYIGSVAGVPVVVSKAIPAGKGYLATKEAITLFIKKDTETEYNRVANNRHNEYFVRKFAVVALTDATKAVKITVAGE
jgi:hypothetical protein